MKDLLNRNWDWNNEEDIIPSPILSESSLFISDDNPVFDSFLCESYNKIENLMELTGEIEETINQIQDYVTYTSIWRGKVLDVMQDHFYAMLSRQDDDKELFVEIAKTAIGSEQLKSLVSGASFNWTFGNKATEPSRQHWKIEFTQMWKPSNEAIEKMAAKMIEGFEHFYDKED